MGYGGPRYFVFQGAGYIGAIVKAVPTLPMSYEYSVEPWGNCEAEGKAAMGEPKPRPAPAPGTIRTDGFRINFHEN